MVSLVSLLGCNGTIMAEDMKICEKICEPNGGCKQLSIRDPFNYAVITCNNLVSITVRDAKEALENHDDTDNQ